MVNASENDRLVWIDCEMTGLDLGVDELVEIAVVITDFELNVLDPGFQIVIKPDDSALANMGEFVTEMHRSSGLLDEIPNGVSLADAEFQTLEYIQRFAPVEGKAPLAGNTIGTDRMFLAKYMPRVDRWLHYRNVDVSSIKELSRRWYPRAYFQAPRRTAATGPSPTSASRSASSRTTAPPCSCPSPVPPATRRRPSRRRPCRRSLSTCDIIFQLSSFEDTWWL